MVARGNPGPTAVYLDHGRRRVLACAADWPGWFGVGNSADLALEALAGRASRYALIPAQADIPFPADAAAAFTVTGRPAGPAAADAGPPGITERDADPTDTATAQRLALLLVSAWAAFYRAAGALSGELCLRLTRHVLAADMMCARRLGVTGPRPSPRDPAGVAALREAIAERVGRPPGRSPVPAAYGGWPARYVARRIGWHVVDHSWAVEDAHGRAVEDAHGRAPRGARAPEAAEAGVRVLG
jgi:hypothetical protein